MAKLNRRRRWRGPALGGRLQRGVRFCFSAHDGEAATPTLTEWARPEIVYAGRRWTNPGDRASGPERLAPRSTREIEAGGPCRRRLLPQVTVHPATARSALLSRALQWDVWTVLCATEAVAIDRSPGRPNLLVQLRNLAAGLLDQRPRFEQNLAMLGVHRIR